MIYKELWRELGETLIGFNEIPEDTMIHLFYDQCAFPVRLQLIDAIVSPLEEQLVTQLLDSHVEDLVEEP